MQQPRGAPRAPDRHRGLPLGRERRRLHRPGARARSGSTSKIVDRETEARLAATGCTPLVDPAAEGVVLFDIGGGSSELVRLGVGPRRRRPAAARDPRLGLAAGRRRDAGRASRRHPRRPRAVRDHGRRGRRATSRAFAGQQLARMIADDPHARHLRHRDHDRGRASRSAALRPAPGRRLLDDRRRRSPVVLDRLLAMTLRGAGRQSLHRRRARRPGARRLRHPGGDPPRASRASACASPIAACAKACWSR